MSCQVCKENSWKYKCPVCSVKYCAIQCFQTHKDHCIQSAEVNRKSLEIAEKLVLQKEYQFPTEDTVPTEKLEKLGKSEKVKKLLENPHLRDVLKALGSAENTEKAMQAAMLEPIFTEYADAVLEIIEAGTASVCLQDGMIFKTLFGNASDGVVFSVGKELELSIELKLFADQSLS